MAHHPPTVAEVESIARELGLHFDPPDVAFFHRMLAAPGALAALLDALPDELPVVRHPRTPGRRPSAEENPLGAWYVKTRIEGAARGPLAGRSVALKDNVLVAGVPMMNGTTLLEGYLPPIDATVVTRILDAGGTITGKAVCESWCFSGGSHTADTGPVRNPRDPSRSAGGSSSGSAALVAAGEVDMAIGCDQGGSIRVPASFCGVVGMKPTHGLVPYTGILSLEPTIDHAGPITRTVADNARLLQAIAGPDGFDPRQAGVRTDDYLDGLERGADGLRIGVLREGFGRHNAEPDVDEAVRAAAARFARLGAKVEEVSVPLHPLAAALTFPVFQSGAFLLFHADGCALGHEDLCVPSLVDRLHAWRERPHALPDTVKYLLLATELLRKRHGFRYWAKAMNFVRRARAAYDDVLGGVDLFLLPTTPMKATPLPLPGGPREAAIEASFAPTANTQIFDHTHHPALSVPCGESQGLPIGMMLVGRRFEEATLYRAAHAFEQTPASKAAQRPRSEAKPSGERAPASKAAQRPRSEAKPSGERAPASKAAQRRGEAKAGEVKEARSAPRRSPSRPGRGKPRRRPSRSRGSRR